MEGTRTAVAFPSTPVTLINLIVGLSHNGIHETLEGSTLVDFVSVASHGIGVMMRVTLLVGPLKYQGFHLVGKRCIPRNLLDFNFYLPFCWAGRPWSARGGTPHVPGCPRIPCYPPGLRGKSRCEHI